MTRYCKFCVQFSIMQLWILIIFITSGIRSEESTSVKSVPTTVETFQNDTVVLPCYVDDLEMPSTVRWWREGIQLADSGDPDLNPAHRIKLHENRSLEVSRVQPEDTGQYVCQASRPTPWGHVTQVYAIQVKYPPKVLHTIPESGELEVNLGEEVDMSCMASGYPIPVISWRMKDTDMQLLDDRPRLRFNAENRSLAGRYTCVASNGIGESAQAHIELRIKQEEASRNTLWITDDRVCVGVAQFTNCLAQVSGKQSYKPEIETRKRWVHASPGIRTQLDCQVTAWPEAQVDWYFKNEKVVYDSRTVKHTSGLVNSLVIRNVWIGDYGYYLCRASNSLGISEKEIELSGVANPAVIKESRSTGKNNYYFIWEVDSYSSIIEYQFWFRNYPSGVWHKLFIPSGSDAIGPVHAKSFNLTGLEEARRYEALVLSRNRYGWSGPSKLLRFATEGALPQKDERYRAGKVFEESATDNNIIILDPMSQHYPMFLDSAAVSSWPCHLFLVLAPLLSLIIKFFV